MLLYVNTLTKIIEATHTDDQNINPGVYGPAIVAIKVQDSSPFRSRDTYTDLGTYDLTIAINNECTNRIQAKVSANTQLNMTAHVVDLMSQSMTGTELTTDQLADITTARAIKTWMTDPNSSSMVANARTLIAKNVQDFYSDARWPLWNDSWNSFVARF